MTVAQMQKPFSIKYCPLSFMLILNCIKSVLKKTVYAVSARNEALFHSFTCALLQSLFAVSSNDIGIC